MQKFKESAFLLSEILRHKVAPLQFDIYHLELTKIRKKSYFMLDNIFSGPKLYSSMYFSGFQANQRIHMFNFSRNNCNNPPGESIFLKFCLN